jgi:NADP-dependent 3-hydroxy acid dehydrogenase YdfG
MDDTPVVLITGGGSGIGAATARQLLDQGHRVTITGRGQDRLRAFAEELGEPPGLLTLTGDAADYDAVRSAVESTVEAFGRLDTVVANAGYTMFDTVADGDPAGWQHMVLTNVLGPALLIRAAVDHLRETRAGSSWSAARRGSCIPLATSTGQRSGR